MRKVIAVLLIGFASIPAGWAQTASEPAADSAQGGSNDAIVQMHQQIAAANAEYNRKVAAAKKVFDAKKAAAAKVRDEKVAAARNGLPTQ